MADYQDTVKHKLNDVVGVVIAVYFIGFGPNAIRYFDVRVDDRIYYKTPAENWETVIAVNE